MFSEELEKIDWEETTKAIYSKTESDVLRALGKEHCDVDDFMALISPAAAKYLEPMAQLSKKYTEERFGKTISMFIPLYITNSCTNSCVYCGFHISNPMARTILTPEQMEDEYKAIKKLGPFENLLLVTGENPAKAGVPYLAKALDIAKKYFSNLKIEVMPLKAEEYAELKKHGLKGTQCRIPDEVLYAIIDGYTREAGVRELERTIGTLCRKAAKEIVEGICKKVSFTEVNLKEYLGIPKFRPDEQSHEDTVGVVNGLAWTSVGGVLMPMEVLVMSGKGTVEYTGSLGNVMQESAKIAVSYARSVAKQYGIPEDFHTKCDLHIHAPEGAVPKDGPSAGVTMATAIISALSGRPVRGDIAMTGEITLHGNVLPIGGLREKSMAAYKAGIHTVIIPEENLPDLEEVDETVREHVTFVPAKTLDTVLNTALVPAEPAAEAQTATAELCHV